MFVYNRLCIEKKIQLVRNALINIIPKFHFSLAAVVFLKITSGN